nr:DUF2793 domain-containing protein [uncultured Cohaesibacter sp.]
MEQTTNLALPYIVGNQNQKHITHNEALRMLDALVQLSVADRDLSAPPAEPEEGARYIVAGGASGAWSGWEGSIAAYLDGAWMRFQPLAGWLAWVTDESRLLCHDGAVWSDFVSTSFSASLADGTFDKIGINATADTTNRLALASAASLFNNAGNGHQIKVNKAAVADTNSLLFQTNWSGRAEMGCAGEDDFSFKVSADGSSWTTALKIARATGLLTGTAVQSSTSDTTSGRLLTVGAFGIGEVGSVPQLADVDDPDTPCGLWGVLGGSTANNASLPTGLAGTAGAKFGMLMMEKYSASRVRQIVWSTVANDAKVFERWYRGAGWESWQLIYGQRNILGTVAQSSGVPTGAIIERGSNANGEYVRFADGTQICTNGNAAITTAAAAFTGTITKIDSDKLWFGRWF